MNHKKYMILVFLFFIVVGMPFASAQQYILPEQNHLFLANVNITCHNGTILLFLGQFFKNHLGVASFIRIWTGTDGYIEIKKIGDTSSNFVLEGNQTITLIGYTGFAVAGGNCSSGVCDPMNVHGKALIASW